MLTRFKKYEEKNSNVSHEVLIREREKNKLGHAPPTKKCIKKKKKNHFQKTVLQFFLPIKLVCCFQVAVGKSALNRSGCVHSKLIPSE